MQFYFKVRKELGFTRLEWDALDWISKRAYLEGFQWEKYREEFQAWKSSGRKGGPPTTAPPKSPDELKKMEPVEYTEQKKSDVAPDIEDLL